MARTCICGFARLRSGMEGKAHDLDAQLRREREKTRQRFGLAAEFARQIDDRIAAERETDQERGAVAVFHELAQLVLVVDHEVGDPVVECRADITIALDRMGVDAAFGGDTQAAHELHLAVRGEIETGALIPEHGHDRGMRQGFDRVVQSDAGQRGGKRAVLSTHALGVDQEQG